jgi:hypothetical protein
MICSAETMLGPWGSQVQTTTDLNFPPQQCTRVATGDNSCNFTVSRLLQLDRQQQTSVPHCTSSVPEYVNPESDRSEEGK